MDKRLVYAVQRHAGHGSCENGVLVALATCCNAKTGDCFPSVSTVAALAHYSLRATKYALKSLRASGLIAVEEVKTGCGKRNRYTFSDALFENQIDLHDCPVAASNDLSTGVQPLHSSSADLALAGVQRLHIQGQGLHSPSATVAHRNKNLINKLLCVDMGTHTQVADADLSGLDALGVPRSFTRRMIADLVASQWRTTKGEAVTSATLAAHIVKWWRCERNQGAYLANGGDGVDAPQQAAKAFTANDWILCRERCAEYGDGGCAAGVEVPPEHSPAPFPPEECAYFSNIKQGKVVTA